MEAALEIEVAMGTRFNSASSRSSDALLVSWYLGLFVYKPREDRRDTSCPCHETPDVEPCYQCKHN